MISTSNARTNRLTLYLKLGKFRLCLLVLFTSMIGYGLGVTEFNPMQLLFLLLGTLLTAMGANALNQCWERRRDALMTRTRHRPLPTGMLSLTEALTISLSSALIGLTVLWIFVNPLTALLGALTLMTYLLLYTPIKPITPIAVLIGAIPGAIPPMMGWSAATNSISSTAIILGFILFLWQIPHFMALASIYKVDYEKGGYRLLPDDPAIERVTRSIIVVFSLALLSISLLAPAAGLGNLFFLGSSFLLGGVLLYLSVQFYRQYSVENARRVFRASIIYLPLLLTILVIDQRILMS